LKILRKDRRTGEVKLRVQALDDLWHLYNVIEIGDLVSALSERRGEARADVLRQERAEKKKMYLGVRVEKIEFHEFSDWLRVHGTIEVGPQDLGAYHTLNIQVDDDLAVQKVWSRQQLDILEQAERDTAKPLITMLAIDDDEAVIAQLRQYGIKQLAALQSHRSGKYAESKADRETEHFNEIIQVLKSSTPGPLLIIGPGFAKERILAYGREKAKEIFANCQMVSSGQSGMASIQEVMKKGMGSKLLEESRVAQETLLVEKLLEEIAKDGKCAYGKKEVLEAVNAGAVETLLVTSNAAREKKFTELLEAAEKTGSRLAIISECHDAGKKLAALGDVGALLRYKIG
jgi:protein pelota